MAFAVAGYAVPRGHTGGAVGAPGAGEPRATLDRRDEGVAAAAPGDAQLDVVADAAPHQRDTVARVTRWVDDRYVGGDVGWGKRIGQASILGTIAAEDEQNAAGKRLKAHGNSSRR